MNDREQLAADVALDLALALEALAQRAAVLAERAGVLHDALERFATEAYADRQDDLLTREGAI